MFTLRKACHSIPASPPPDHSPASRPQIPIGEFEIDVSTPASTATPVGDDRERDEGCRDPARTASPLEHQIKRAGPTCLL
jgi:hypothetical protein